MRITIILFALIMLCGCKPSPSLDTLENSIVEQQPKFSEAANRIEQFYLAQGSYPSKVEEVENLIVPTVETPKDFESLRASQMFYEVSRDKKFFRISYGLYDYGNSDVHAALSYLSFNKKWEFSRNANLFVHVEAGDFGKQYQENLSKQYLSLTVQSLIDAASNDVHPCRNFWKDWVIKNLGPGRIMQLHLPERTEIKEAVVYVANDHHPVYAFEFISRLYPPIKEPLMIVEKVYQAGAADGEWSLLQQCDSSS